MNGAVSLFNFSYGFGLALLREWFYPVLFIILLIAFLILATVVRGIHAKMAKRN